MGYPVILPCVSVFCLPDPDPDSGPGPCSRLFLPLLQLLVTVHNLQYFQLIQMSNGA